MYNKANKATLSELNKQHEIVKLLSTSLSKAHVKAEEVSRKTRDARQELRIEFFNSYQMLCTFGERRC